MNRLAPSIVAAFWLVAPGLAAAAPEPHALSTVAAIERAQCDFETRRALAAFVRSPKHNAAFDARATAFITGCLQLWHHQPAAPEFADLERLGRLLYVDGCDDALVQSFYGRLIVRVPTYDPLNEGSFFRVTPTHLLTVGAPFLHRAHDGLAKQGYPAAFDVETLEALEYVEETRLEDDALKKTRPALAAAIIVAATDPSIVDPQERRLLAYDVRRWIIRRPMPHLKMFAERIGKSKTADPVVAQFALARYEFGLAYDKNSNDHAAKAREHFEKAWALDPTLPLSATLMVYLCTREKDEPGVELWFDRAVHACFDDDLAYRDLLESLQFGDDPAAADKLIFERGLAFARTRRFDTAVPSYFFDACRILVDRLGGDFEVLNEVDAWPTLRDVCQGYLAAHASPRQDDYYNSALAAYAARLGHFAEARQAMDRVGDRLDPDGAARAGLTPLQLRGIVYGNTGPAAAVAAMADNFAATARVREAADSYAAAAKLDPAPDAVRYFRGQAQATQWQIAYDAGQWIELKADKDFSGFEAEHGQWTADADGSFTLHTTETESKLVCLIDPGERWEMSCDVTFLRAADYWSNAAIVLTPRGPGLWHCVQFCRNAGKVFADDLYFEGKAVPAEIHGFNHLLVRLDDTGLTATLNGKRIVTGKQVGADPEDLQYIAFGAQLRQTGDLIRFERVKLHKLPKGKP